MTDYEYLKYLVKKEFGTQSELAKRLGKCETVISKALSGDGHVKLRNRIKQMVGYK